MARIPLPALKARDSSEPSRTVSSLELFFDLVFVVAVALASQNLHHFESDDHFGTGIVRFLMVFFAIWWAWMNFTWFASAYASDDWQYRVLTLVQMAGALVIAAGVPEAMNENRYPMIIVGYMVMRLALVIQWLRAATGDPERRRTALAYAAGIVIVQIIWASNLVLPESWLGGMYIFAVLCELTVPVVAERYGATPWHPHHIVERFGLLTLIVLGESILASSLAIIEGIDVGDQTFAMMRLAIAAFVIVAAMWWIYFTYPQHDSLNSFRKTFRFSYSHFFIFASAAAVSAGIEVAVDYQTDHTSLSAAKAAATLCVPVAIFVIMTWFVMIRPKAGRVVNAATPVVAIAVLLSVFVPYPLQVTALLMIVLVALITRQTMAEPELAHGR